MKKLWFVLFDKSKGHCGLFRTHDYDVDWREVRSGTNRWIDGKEITRKDRYRIFICKNCQHKIYE